MFEFLFNYPRELYAQSELAFAQRWPEWLPVVLAVLGVAAVVWFLYVRRSAARPWQLISIGALQLAMLALVIVVLLEPELETEQLREGENSVALLLDTSGSMSYGPERARIVDGRNLLEAAMGDGGGLALPVQRYTFAERSQRVESFGAAPAAGTRTAMADAVLDVLREARVNPLAAVIVASDGADTTNGITANQLAEIAAFGVPVHGVAVGRERMPEDLELADVIVPARVLPDSTVSARVTIRHDAAGATQLKVYDDDNLLASTPVVLGNGATTTTRVEFRLADAGPHRLQFSLDRRDGEQELRNNRRERLVEVHDDTYSVLYVEGEPRWEYKFLRRALHDDTDIELVSLLRVSPNKFYRQGLTSPEQLENGFPSTAEELYAFDALMIGSIEAASLTRAQQELIRDFVGERGGSLVLLGGRYGLGNGGWGQSPVADALPTRLPLADANSFSRVHARAALTPQGMANPMLRLAADDASNLDAWGGLPDVADYQLTGTLKPAAVALLTANTEQGVLPLFVTQAYGRGRSYVLATGGTWRWQMSLPVEDQRHETFWRQLVRGIVSSALPASSLTTVARPGAGGVSLRAEFRDAAYAAHADITAHALVANEAGGTWTVPLTPKDGEAGVFLGELDPGASGSYFVEAFAVRGEETVASTRSSVSYEAGQAEHFRIRSNPGVLQRVADVTGGRLLKADELSELSNLLRYSKAGISDIEKHPIWDMPALFLILGMLKFIEWLLRRRWGSI